MRDYKILPKDYLPSDIAALRDKFHADLNAELAKRDEAERLYHAQLLADIERRKAERDVSDLA